MKKSEEIFHQNTDYKEILFKLWRYKHYFIFSLIFTLGIAYAFNKYTQPRYSNVATLLIAEENNNSFMSADGMMEGLSMFSGIKNVENELSILKSFSVINQTLQELNLEVSYKLEENMLPFDFVSLTSQQDLYDKSPIHVILDQTHQQAVNAKFFVEVLNDTSYRLTCNEEEVYLYNYISNSVVGFVEELNVLGVYKFGDKVTSDLYSFSMHLNEGYNPDNYIDKSLCFSFNNLYYLTASIRANLSVATTTTTSSVVMISLSGDHPKKLQIF
ncbi:MAG: Wzz/FepE/Etk N-terminal domain-containing protein [Bacteroidales bacterium]